MHRGFVCALVLWLASCSSGDNRQSCDEAAECMVSDCGDEFETFATCVEASGAAACDAENVAVGMCADACQSPELSSERAQAAFDLFLCEVGDDPEDDCSLQDTVCSAAG